jgi:hypothetical protein
LGIAVELGVVITQALVAVWFYRLFAAAGWILIAGGVGYVLSAFLDYLLADGQALVDALVIPATVGELWMIACLLVRGVRPRQLQTL